MVVGGLVLASVMGWFGGSAVIAYDGDLEATFGSGGVLGIAMGPWDGWGRRGAVQPNGMLVIAGVVEDADDDFALTRVTPIGSLDTFGSGGRVYWDSGWGDDGGWDVAIQDDGKIVVVGTARLDGSDNLTVLRFEADGTPDTSFGYNGYSTIDFGLDSKGRAVAVQSDGTIVVAGQTTDGQAAVARLDNSGALDSTFGTGGIFGGFAIPLRGERTIWDLDLFGDLIVVVGSLYVEAIPPLVGGSTFAYLLAIDGDGQQAVETPYDLGGDSEARGVAVQPDGKIVMVGVAEVESSIAVARLDGLDLDTSFSDDGIYRRDFGEGDDQGWDLVLQSDGRIVVAGSAIVDGYLQAVVLRLGSDGSLDKFGPEVGGVPQGYNAFRFGLSSTARSVAFTNDAKLLVAGDAVASNGRAVFFAAKMEMPSLAIFVDGFESGGASAWSSQVP
jgi:uncharacterized delta-60 repeat protein